MTNFFCEMFDTLKTAHNTNLNYNWSMFFEKAVKHWWSDDNKVITGAIVAINVFAMINVMVAPMIAIIWAPVFVVTGLIALAYLFAHFPRNRNHLISVQFRITRFDGTSYVTSVSYPRWFWAQRSRTYQSARSKLFADNGLVWSCSATKFQY